MKQQIIKKDKEHCLDCDYKDTCEHESKADLSIPTLEGEEVFTYAKAFDRLEKDIERNLLAKIRLNKKVK
jgi:hypothetical protein